MTNPPAPSILSRFWSPLCAVGSHGPQGPNAQICVSVFGASIVPEQPRLLVNLSNTNLTTELVAAAGTLSITLLAQQQVGLLEPLGLRSGRTGNKLTGIDFALSDAGDPWFEGGAGAIDCTVIEAYDLGDATAFLCSVRTQRAAAHEPLTWAQARAIVGSEFLERWAAKSQREQAAARASMHWAD